MACQRCNSNRVAVINSKSSDMNGGTVDGQDIEELTHGYVPSDVGIGGGDYLAFEWCLNCGQLQGDWPVPIKTKEF